MICGKGGVEMARSRGAYGQEDEEGRDERGEDIPQERILVPNQRECLRELGLRVCVVLEGLGSGRTHG